MNLVQIGPGLAVVLVVFTVLTAALIRWSGLGTGTSTVVAAARAVLQLAAVSAVIVVVLQSIWWTLAFLLVMLGVAAATAGHRITDSWRPPGWWAGASIVVGVVPVMVALVFSGVIPSEPIAILPVAGMLIGSTMTATSLAGRNMGNELSRRRGEYEAALAIGLPRRDAVHLVGKPAAGLALIPGMDQTRTVGLVVLPGAFVGLLLAGASPWHAGAAQLLVLIALLLCQSIAVVATVELIAADLLPAGRHRLIV